VCVCVCVCVCGCVCVCVCVCASEREHVVIFHTHPIVDSLFLLSVRLAQLFPLRSAKRFDAGLLNGNLPGVQPRAEVGGARCVLEVRSA
jgi:hypothetical protein